MTLPYKNLGQVLGHDTLLTCIVSSNPSATVTWFFNSTTLSSSAKYTISSWNQDTYVKVIGLLIRNLDASDLGIYTCLATNSLGETNRSVYVQGKVFRSNF